MMRVVAAWKKAETPMPVSTSRTGLVLLPWRATTSAMATKLPTKAENTTRPDARKANQ